MHARLLSPYPIARRAARFLTAMLLATCATAAQAEDPPIDWDTLSIGIVIESAVPPQVARASFEVRDPDAPAEIYTVRVYDLGASAIPLTDDLVGEASLLVDGVDPVPREALGIDTPPLTMQFVRASIDLPAGVSGRLFYVVDVARDQALKAGSFPFLEEVCDDPQTYYSIDEGANWQALDAGELECLLSSSPVCEDDSTYVRLHVRP